MKRILLFGFFILTSIGLFSQVDFSSDTVTLILQDGVSHEARIRLTNNTGHPVNLKWTLISSTLNDNDDGDSDNSNNWKLKFCDCVICYSNNTEPLPTSSGCVNSFSPHPDSNTMEWYLGVDPNNQPLIDGEWIIEVENVTDSLFDTLVYYALHPNSVKEVSYNADVTSYPNPANTEFVVNYTLTNVSAPTLNVYSIVGGKIGTYALNQVNGSLNINTFELENGMYFYTIEEQGQRVFIQKFNVVH